MQIKQVSLLDMKQQDLGNSLTVEEFSSKLQTFYLINVLKLNVTLFLVFTESLSWSPIDLVVSSPLTDWLF